MLPRAGAARGARAGRAQGGRGRAPGGAGAARGRAAGALQGRRRAPGRRGGGRGRRGGCRLMRAKSPSSSAAARASSAVCGVHAQRRACCLPHAGTALQERLPDATAWQVLAVVQPSAAHADKLCALELTACYVPLVL